MPRLAVNPDALSLQTAVVRVRRPRTSPRHPGGLALELAVDGLTGWAPAWLPTAVDPAPADLLDQPDARFVAAIEPAHPQRPVPGWHVAWIAPLASGDPWRTCAWCLTAKPAVRSTDDPVALEIDGIHRPVDLCPSCEIGACRDL